MTPQPWACVRCGAPGTRNLGTSGYCGNHLTELLDTFDPSIWAANGIGLPRGLERPEFGTGQADLTCIACGATWVGAPADHCGWCRRSRELLADHQRSILLRVPEIDPDHQDADTVLMAWGARLRRAVEAGVLTRSQAKTVWHRAVNHHAAAA